MFFSKKIKNGLITLFAILSALLLCFGGIGLYKTQSTKTVHADDPTAKSVYSEVDNSLTFYFDAETHTEEGTVYPVPVNAYYLGDWGFDVDKHSGDIKKVVFDQSFKEFTGLKSAKYMVNEFSNLEKIENLSYLNTSNVTTMKMMFCGCSKLTELDLSNFNTENVTDMFDMFYGCENLESINLTSFNTKKVTTMRNMFQGCKKLQNIDVSSFDTSKVEEMQFMFAECVLIESFDLTNFNTASLTNMARMFNNCLALKTVDLSSFDTAKVTDMGGLFMYDSELKTVLASKKFVVDNVTRDESMFGGCVNLVGGNGTKYDGNYNGKTYARIDGGETAKGYFTNGVKFAKAVCKDGINGVAKGICFFYDTNEYGEDSFDFPQNAKSPDDWGYASIREKVVIVMFDESFKDFKDYNSIAYMFYGFSGLRGIGNFDFLNTSCATDMSHMFDGCIKLNELDLSYFDTSNVTNMSGMFKYCVEMEQLDLSTFDTSKVTDMSGMFDGCSKIEQFNLSTFDTSKVTDMSGMFKGCNNLKTITVSDYFNVDSVTNGDDMFYGCTSIVGGNFTEYSIENTGLSYAIVDGEDGDGYFTSDNPKKPILVFDEQEKTLTYYYDKVDHSGTGLKVYEYLCRENSTDGEYYADGTSDLVETVVIDCSFSVYKGLKKMDNMFAMFSSVTSFIGLENLNTSIATSMGSLFYNCTSIESLDLSSFDTKNVTDMQYMFANCESLKSLNILSFDVGKVENMTSMFYNCINLTVIDLSSFDMKGSEGQGVISVPTPDIWVNMSGMFQNCVRLHTILVSENFKVSDRNAFQDPCDNMFTTCLDLEGENGTRFDASIDQHSYARIDGRGGAGYFTLKKLLPIGPANVSLKKGVYYYFGETVCPQITGLEEGYYTLSGDASVNSSGNFTVTLNLKKGYYFNDKLTNTLSFDYEVKLAPSDCVKIEYVNLAYESSVYILYAVRVDYVEKVPDFYVWRTGDGEYSTEDEDCVKILPEPEMATIRENEYYIFVYTGVSAKEMSDNVYAMAKVGTCHSEILKYSVIEYVHNTFDTQTQDFKDLLSAMLDYGTAAQKAFKVTGESGEKVPYNANRLANADYYEVSVSSEIDGFGFIDGSTRALVCSGETVYFNNEDDFVLLSNGDKKVILSQSVNSYTFTEITEDVTISALKLSPVTVTVKVDNIDYGTIKVRDNEYSEYSFSSFDGATVKVNGNSLNFIYEDEETPICDSILFVGKTDLINVQWDIPNLSTDTATISDDGSGKFIITAKVLTETAKAVYEESTTTLTFYYDGIYHSGDGIMVFELTEKTFDGLEFFDDVPYYDVTENVTKVVFDESFKGFKLTSTKYMFFGFFELTEIEGLTNLDTESVTDMSSMFANCSSLTALDLSTFNTASVTDMNNMFGGCQELETLDLSSFNTASVTNMDNMFGACQNLQTLDLSTFNTANVTDMNNMFYGCNGLTTLDISTFNTASVAYMSDMFNYCANLTKITVSRLFVLNDGVNGDNMFMSCDKLVGGNGTKFDSGKTNGEYARIDGLDGKPGYFTEKE